MNDLEKLFADSLNQIQSGEERLLAGFADFEKTAHDSAVKSALREQARQTQQHLSVLQPICNDLAGQAGARLCHGVEGIIDEALMTADDFKGHAALDLTLLAFARKIAHYKIASYGSLASWAEELNQRDTAESLKEIVGQEKEAEDELARGAEALLREGSEAIRAVDSKTLFLRHLRGVFDAEHLLVSALAELQFYATSPILKLAFRMHRAETEKHSARLETIFTKLSETADRKPCDGVEGIIDDAQVTVMEFLGNWALDAALIAAAQQAEHYEISSYLSVLPWAEALGYNDILPLIQENLDDEIATDKKLTFAAEWLRNPKAKKRETAKHSPEEAEFLKLATHAG